ncbi:NAD(P)-dependent oxidoreductase, partial [Staphylococcus epidermidis]|uniref:NAD(P)-dependent oxidoreductase n=1 Tax=Staphylococcus epidermidis TaxID=1282 RepID=UPI0028CB5374
NQFHNRPFNKIKNHPLFINIPRGPIVDHQALLQPLKKHQIQPSSLHLIPQQPIQPHHPILKLPNPLLLPHIPTSSQLTTNPILQLSIHNIKPLLNNDAP